MSYHSRWAEAAMIAAGPLSAPLTYVLVASYGTGTTTTAAVSGSRQRSGRSR